MSSRLVLRVAVALALLVALVVVAHHAGGSFMDTLRRMHGQH